MNPFSHLFRIIAAVTLLAAYRLFSAAGIPLAPLMLGADEITKIADLWVPEVWQQGLTEPVVEKTAFLDSGVVVTDPKIVEAASGAGVEGNIPFIIEPNPDDQQQKEDTAPETRKISSGLQKCAIVNRVSPLSGTALAKAVSGADPIRTALASVMGIRKRQRNKVVISQLSGLFDVTAAPAANTGAFKSLRLDHFSETSNTDSDKLIDSEMMLDALVLAGENKELFTGGAILMHSIIENALSKQEQIDVIRNSQGQIVLRQWKGMTVYITDKLTRAGGVSGKVYYTFFCGLGSIAMGDKPQIVTDLAGEVAALQLDQRDIAKNNVTLYDRTRYILHPQGAKWNPGAGVPSAADAGPSNAEFADDANWALAYNDIKNVRLVCLRTNG